MGTLSCRPATSRICTTRVSGRKTKDSEFVATYVPTSFGLAEGAPQPAIPSPTIRATAIARINGNGQLTYDDGAVAESSLGRASGSGIPGGLLVINPIT